MTPRVIEKATMTPPQVVAHLTSPVKPRAADQDRLNTSRIRYRIALAVITIPTLGFLLAGADLVLTGFVPWKFMLLGTLYFSTLFGIEAGFHRLISHGAYTTPLRDLFVVLGSMAAQGPVFFWAATHRQHHAFSDEQGDPHSPQSMGPGMLGRVRGFFHGHCGWLIQPDQVDWNRFALDLLKDRRLFSLNQTYGIWVFMGLALPASIGALVEYSLKGNALAGAWEGFIWGGLARIFLVHHAVWAVNSACHIFGSRPFAAKGVAANVAWLALPSLGGSWHNNHHAFPSTADNQFAWWQLDCSGMIVKGLQFVGLVHHLKKPTASAIEARRQAAKVTDVREYVT